MKVNIEKIGMRNIKTALSVFICIVITKAFKMEYPFYAAIAAVISMQSTVKSSIKAGRNRMLGTFIGALVGFLCSLISPGNVFLSGLGIIIVIYVCTLLHWNESASIGSVVFLAIMLNIKHESPIVYSTSRIIDTFIGIIVALLVNYFVAPPKDKKD